MIANLFSDCDNCQDCRNNKCYKCNDGYALTKIYVRRLCVRANKCWGGEKMAWFGTQS